MNNKYLSNISGLLESTVNGAYHFLHKFQHARIEHLGPFGLIFLPVLDFIKFISYLYKIRQSTYTKDTEYKGLTALFHLLKFTATLSGVILAIMGLPALGFTMIFAANIFSTLRSLHKACSIYFFEDRINQNEVARKHLSKGLLNAAYISAFALMFIFPPVPMAAFSIAVGTALIHAVWMLIEKFEMRHRHTQPITTDQTLTYGDNPKENITNQTKQTLTEETKNSTTNQTNGGTVSPIIRSKNIPIPQPKNENYTAHPQNVDDDEADTLSIGDCPIYVSR